MSAIFVFTTKTCTTQPRPQVSLVNSALTCKEAVLLTSSVDDTYFSFKTIKGKALKFLQETFNLDLQRAYLGQWTRKISYTNNTFVINQIKNLPNTKRLKSKLTNLLRVTKRFHFQNQTEVNKTNIKQSWRILNNAIGQNKKKTPTYPLVDENGESITSTEKVINKFGR